MDKVLLNKKEEKSFSIEFKKAINDAEAKLIKYKKKVIKNLINIFRVADYTKMEEGVRKNKEHVCLIRLVSYIDLQKLRYGPGFYIILSNFKFEQNQCKLIIGKKYKAIYRGHGNRIRKRIESHLFNIRYKQNQDGTSYDVCMKVENKESGINIDSDERYKEFEWLVIEHYMPKSKVITRELCEQAFDSVFNRPMASREI